MQPEELGEENASCMWEMALKYIGRNTFLYNILFFSYVSFPAAGGLFHSHVSILGDCHPADQRRDTRGSQRRHWVLHWFPVQFDQVDGRTGDRQRARPSVSNIFEGHGKEKQHFKFNLTFRFGKTRRLRPSTPCPSVGEESWLSLLTTTSTTTCSKMPSS